MFSKQKFDIYGHNSTKLWLSNKTSANEHCLPQGFVAYSSAKPILFSITAFTGGSSGQNGVWLEGVPEAIIREANPEVSDWILSGINNQNIENYLRYTFTLSMIL